MTESREVADQALPEWFEWHPRYRGKAVGEVYEELRGDLERDQRAAALTMEGAEQEEHAALATVMDLDKKWSAFSLDWATVDAADLTTKIVAFEQERERRRELIPYDAYRREMETVRASDGGSGWSLEVRPSLVWLLVAVVVVVIALLVVLT